jgi:hypothetical protein
MTGAMGATEAIGQTRHANSGRKPRRVHLGDRGHEDEGDALRSQHRKIGCLAPRISGEILVRGELLRVDENRRYHMVAFGSRRTDQRQMTLVQRAHSRHQADPLAGFPPDGDMAPQTSNCPYDVQLTTSPLLTLDGAGGQAGDVVLDKERVDQRHWDRT